MAGLGIPDLARPMRQYCVDLWPAARRCGFETLTDSQEEDLLRARKLRAAAKKYPDMIDADAAKALAAELEAAGSGGDVPDSLASSVSMREQRVKITGALWRLLKEGGA
jgi:hypothetical protein